MKQKNWLVIALIAIVVILIMFWVGTLVGGGGYGGYGMMGSWGRGTGMMGNWGVSPFGWFGMGIGMLFMWLIPIGIIALVVYGVVALARNAGNNSSTATPCPNCGKYTQTGWKNCPYCGTALK